MLHTPAIMSAEASCIRGRPETILHHVSTPRLPVTIAGSSQPSAQGPGEGWKEEVKEQGQGEG